MCAESTSAVDAIIIENFNPSYLLFERAAQLQQVEPSLRVLVPVTAASRDLTVPNPVSAGIAELMARLARVANVELIPVQEIEPYALNVASQLRAFLRRNHLRSVTVIAPAFRSKRTSLVYGAVLGPAGIQSHCIPVLEGHTPENWTATWHGIEVVAEQFLKLQFYRFYVLAGSGH
jgi:hypothetical protein